MLTEEDKRLVRDFYFARERLEQILAEVSEATGVSVSHIMSKSQRRDPTRARDLVIWILRRETGASHPRIGRLMKRDPSSITQALERERKRRTPPE
jgi:chromosomal replication initiation ATPase DnaA